MKKTAALVVILVLAVLGAVIFSRREAKDAAQVPPAEGAQQVVTLADGRQCYVYSHDATSDAPYTASEFMDITIKGATVTGTKKGMQSGPDMTNGYTGTITGTLADNGITDVYSYVIEGSPNKEEEIYRAGPVGLEKLRYPLVQGKGMLVPDTTKPFTVLTYARVGCEASN